MDSLTSPWGILGQLFNLLGIVPGIIVVGASIYLYSRQKNSPALLMVVGSIIELGLAITYRVINFLMMQLGMGTSEMVNIYAGLSVVGLVGGVLFAVGLLQQVNQWVNQQNQKPPADY
ncbi:MAG: hypothetical protein MUC97_06300 [Bernardetiaceae bacterium]|jgi:membrane associated rhomboid family serine protease|nr:hypothetical protein [Bernardetiaceae bacterium]